MLKAIRFGRIVFHKEHMEYVIDPKTGQQKAVNYETKRAYFRLPGSPPTPYDNDMTSVGSGISWDDAISMLNAWKTANPNIIVNVSITQ